MSKVGVVVITMQYGCTTSKLLATVLLYGCPMPPALSLVKSRDKIKGGGGGGGVTTGFLTGIIAYT